MLVILTILGIAIFLCGSVSGILYERKVEKEKIKESPFRYYSSVSMMIVGFVILLYPLITWVTKGDKCPECKAEYSISQNYCKECGYDFKPECSGCGCSISYDDKFCANCGEEVPQTKE